MRQDQSLVPTSENRKTLNPRLELFLLFAENKAAPISDDLLDSLIIIPEFLGRTPFFAFEYAIEIGYVVESALKTDLGNGLRRIDQHPNSMTKTNFNQIIRKTFSRSLTEKTAEGRRAHTYKFRQLIQANLFCIITIDICIDFLHSPAVSRITYTGERTAGQRAGFTKRQLVQNG